MHGRVSPDIQDGERLGKPCGISDNGFMPEWTLADELRRQPLNLARGALLCAQAVAYPQLRVGDYLAELAAVAQSAAAAIPPGDPPLYRGLLLAETLFGVLGFRGNKENYGDPRNSFLNEVLARKRGIPITLSILYLDVAQRLEIPAYGIGLPGHFIVGLDDGRARWFLDPFHGGGRLSLNECARLVEGATGYDGPLNPAWLEPAAPEAILVRLLHNLRIGYVREGQWEQAVTVIEQLRLLQPDLPEHLRDLGLIHHRRRAPRLAAAFLEEYLQRAPDAPDADTIREGMSPILDAWARLN